MAARNRSNHRFGVVYKVRLLFLFAMVIIASWYANQEYNNPFAPRPRIKIAGTKEYVYIRCYQELRKSEKEILLFLQPLSTAGFSNSSSNMPHGVDNLVTPVAGENIFAFFVPPPKNWTILRTRQEKSSLLQLPVPWPEPVYSNSITEQTMATIQRIYPFSDTIPGISLTYDAIRILYLNDISAFSEKNSESLVKEKFDIIILNTTDRESILAIRRNLRPKYLIIAPITGKAAQESLSNVLYHHRTDFNFSILKDSKNRIQVEIK